MLYTDMYSPASVLKARNIEYYNKSILRNLHTYLGETIKWVITETTDYYTALTPRDNLQSPINLNKCYVEKNSWGEYHNTVLVEQQH